MAKYNTVEDIPFFTEYNKNLYPNLLNTKYGINVDMSDDDEYAALIEQVLCVGIPGYEDEQTRFLVTEEAEWPADIKVYQKEAIEFATEATKAVMDARVYPSGLLQDIWFKDRRDGVGSLITPEAFAELSGPDIWCMVEQVLGDELYGDTQEDTPYPFEIQTRTLARVTDLIDSVEVVEDVTPVVKRPHWFYRVTPEIMPVTPA